MRHFVAICLVLVLGCGRDDGRVSVTGTVRVDGELVTDGIISLAPGEGTRGPSATAKLVDGVFRIDAEYGPVAGEYDVVVRVGELPVAGTERGAAPGGRPVLEAGTRFQKSVEIEPGPNEFELEFFTTPSTEPVP